MPGTATTIRIDGTPTDGADPWIDSLVWGGKWTDSDGGTVTISWTAFQGTMDGENSYTWSAFQLAQLREALAVWENVANIDFVEVASDAEADARFWWGTEAQAGGPDVLGWSDAPGYSGSETLDILFNGDTGKSLTKGGLGLLTMVHEIGHLLGLAHPHDGGSADDATTFPGVEWWSAYDYGDEELNQGIFTVMSYNYGWPSMLPGHMDDWYGLQSGPMALDIAAIQAIYGANKTYASGNNVYKLPLINTAGTYWSAIWDTGGKDTISAMGAAGKATIDLRVTTGSSGGHVSYVNSSSGAMVAGGFTIAASVIIENAIGGNNDDTLIGNAVRNQLDGGMGDDQLDGGVGVDTMIGGPGSDRFYVDDVGDVVVEVNASNSSDMDVVYSTVVSYTLAASVENLTLLGTASINGTGNGDNNTIVGNEGDNVLDGGGGIDYLYGGKGNDTYIFRFQSTVVELAGEGVDTILTDWTPGTLPDNIENVELLPGGFSAHGNALDNRLVGNDDWNSLDGGAGNDTLIGGIGWDTMVGGAGNDSYYVDNAGDKVQEFGDPSDIDAVYSSISYVLGANLENLVLIGTGNLNGTGNGLTNALWGNAGKNVLDGMAGADTMAGGPGNDTYRVDNAGDMVIEANGQGTDLVQSSVGFSLLGQYIENLTLTGAGNINGTGNSLANVLTGNGGNNILDGGTNADRMVGGAGNDTYRVDNAGDIVIEANGQGTDLVQSSVGFSLLGQYIENLTLTGAGNINGTGNSLANVLTGNAGNNVLDGGANADRMVGGAGNDTYRVDNAGDVVVEASGQGTDLVQSSVAFSLLGQYIENLTLTGAGNINGTGNSLANVLTGNAGNNLLDGGANADRMVGGAGNDTYRVDNAGDVVIEASGQGTDTVQSSVGFSLLGQYIENLTLTGTANINGTGNSLANTITGNAGNNALSGGGGSDIFAFNTALGPSNIDVITDFSVAADTISLDLAIYTAIVGTGILSAGQFVANSSGTAQDANDRIIYETDTGKLFYDSNGSATGQSIQFAQLDAGLAITNADFLIV